MKPRCTLILIATLFIAGCAGAHNPVDPLEPLNRNIYKFNDTLDKTVVKPVAKGYSAVMPSLGKMMVSNFFSNLDDVSVTINDVLQLKFEQAASDGMRFIVNSTIGVFGLIDVASMGPLKKHNEDFGQTLGKWGVGSGAYLMLPILGPSSVRDGIGRYADSIPSPTSQISDVPVRNQVYIAQGINRRAELLDQEKVLNGAMLDPYEFIRDAYLQRRVNLVYDGNPPRTKYDDEELDSDIAPIAINAASSPVPTGFDSTPAEPTTVEPNSAATLRAK
ncbi:MAG: VacJ family lipoprotein [Gallionella sp.]